MRYMRWSWPEYLACPDDLIDVIDDMAKEAAKQAQRAQQQASSGPSAWRRR